MSFHVDAWDPSYGASLDAAPGSPADGLDVDVELPASEWRPLSAPAGLTPPATVLMVDGVRRIDARIWTAGSGGLPPYPGLACSYAAGVVRCTATGAQVAAAQVERTIFTAARDQSDVAAAGGSIRYTARLIEGAQDADLMAAAQSALMHLEQQTTADVLTTLADGGDELIVVDGPLRGPGAPPRVLGYAKTQQKQYLPDHLLPVVSELAPGQRTPVFRIGGRWTRYTWYLRQPGGMAIPWSGVVRVECSAELSPQAAIDLAHLSCATLPRYASSVVKDPRAPQQLIPIGGLEQRLRRMLGDTKLLQRALVSASAR
ncbi:hypothetical protein [Hamadaea tsunoensis]|uniref:hypothetical protein n=1 Tax=Hamadaea tsunoensis TaxID=53368 RepID=UPI0003F6957C|nr:hypothetical protein [Hamadaea tsunoensis]